MITRKDYLDGDATHEDYYGDIIAAASVRSQCSPEFIDMCWHEHQNGNKFLNPGDCTPEGDCKALELARWDARAERLLANIYLDKAFRERGDYPTQAGLVCLIKQAVIGEGRNKATENAAYIAGPTNAMHLLESANHRRARIGSRVAGPYVLCGNGSFHVKSTNNPEAVTCSVCKDKLKEWPNAAK